MSGRIRIEIDREVCTGHGRCYDLAPKVFTDDERGYGQVIASVIGSQQSKQAHLAAGACPERAITLTTIADDNGSSA
jgi:ferredoxin